MVITPEQLPQFLQVPGRVVLEVAVELFGGELLDLFPELVQLCRLMFLAFGGGAGQPQSDRKSVV